MKIDCQRSNKLKQLLAQLPPNLLNPLDQSNDNHKSLQQYQPYPDTLELARSNLLQSDIPLQYLTDDFSRNSLTKNDLKLPHEDSIYQSSLQVQPLQTNLSLSSTEKSPASLSSQLNSLSNNLPNLPNDQLDLNLFSGFNKNNSPLNQIKPSGFSSYSDIEETFSQRNSHLSNRSFYSSEEVGFSLSDLSDFNRDSLGRYSLNNPDDAVFDLMRNSGLEKFKPRPNIHSFPSSILGDPTPSNLSDSFILNGSHPHGASQSQSYSSLNKNQLDFIFK